MGGCLTIVRALRSVMPMRRIAEPRRIQQSNSCSHPFQSESYGCPAMCNMHQQEDVENCHLIADPTSDSMRTTNNHLEIQELTDDTCPLQGSSRLRKLSTEKSVRKPESELKEKTALTNKRKRSRRHDKNTHGLEDYLERTHRQDQETLLNASEQVVQPLKSNTLEMGKALEDAKSNRSKLETKCQKLEAQLALIEQKAAQESLTSGSYSDDHANPGMLEGACKAVDKATENLARVLHNGSVTKLFPLTSSELEQFVCQICPARPAEFSRPIQVKYVWAHWICSQMFQGFEHVFFEVDGGQLTSPLDSKKHALECFQSFQQKQSASSLDSCGIFQAFCSRKCRSVLPPWLVKQALLPKDIVCNENGRFDGDGEIFESFTDVTRSVWLLHELAFSFDPPASILRMARGKPYDEQFHEPVIHVEDGPGLASQMVSLMIRPGFRVRKSIIQSRVFLCNNPNTDVIIRA